MATIKAYTDLSQSKKLAEILPLESADACWTNHMFGSLLSSWRIENTQPQEYKYLLDRFVVKGYLIEPAWSLAALINVIKSAVEDYTMQSIDCKKSFIICELNDKLWSITAQYDNEVDACVDMILKLYKLNLL